MDWPVYCVPLEISPLSGSQFPVPRLSLLQNTLSAGKCRFAPPFARRNCTPE